MATEIKFCGLTRPEDARLAVELGASYTGVIFAGGPREVSPARAREVLFDVSAPIQRVGVFADQSGEEIASVSTIAGLQVVQVHGAFDASRIAKIRRDFRGEIWQVVRVTGAVLPESMKDIVHAADGLLLDAYAPGTLGGTGIALPWAELADAIAPFRADVRFILAGGLRPENVARAIALLAPDVVDVSSGVEAAPGIKDHDRMRAFRDAVREANHTAIP